MRHRPFREAHAIATADEEVVADHVVAPRVDLHAAEDAARAVVETVAVDVVARDGVVEADARLPALHVVAATPDVAPDVVDEAVPAEGGVAPHVHAALVVGLQHHVLHEVGRDQMLVAAHAEGAGGKVVHVVVRDFKPVPTDGKSMGIRAHGVAGVAHVVRDDARAGGPEGAAVPAVDLGGLVSERVQHVAAERTAVRAVQDEARAAEVAHHAPLERDVGRAGHRDAVVASRAEDDPLEAEMRGVPHAEERMRGARELVGGRGGRLVGGRTQVEDALRAVEEPLAGRVERAQGVLQVERRVLLGEVPLVDEADRDRARGGVHGHGHRLVRPEVLPVAERLEVGRDGGRPAREVVERGREHAVGGVDDGEGEESLVGMAGEGEESSVAVEGEDAEFRVGHAEAAGGVGFKGVEAEGLDVGRPHLAARGGGDARVVRLAPGGGGDGPAAGEDGRLVLPRAIGDRRVRRARILLAERPGTAQGVDAAAQPHGDAALRAGLPCGAHGVARPRGSGERSGERAGGVVVARGRHEELGGAGRAQRGDRRKRNLDFHGVPIMPHPLLRHKGNLRNEAGAGRGSFSHRHCKPR